MIVHIWILCTSGLMLFETIQRFTLSMTIRAEKIFSISIKFAIFTISHAKSTFLFGTPARCRALINLVGPRSYGFEDRSYRRIVRQRYYINFLQIIDAWQDLNLQPRDVSLAYTSSKARSSTVELQASCGATDGI